MAAGTVFRLSRGEQPVHKGESNERHKCKVKFANDDCAPVKFANGIVSLHTGCARRADDIVSWPTWMVKRG